ncbi:aprataxin and PNK-like factor isoform X2 [Cottoperca gobio]|nr:aprataxin and PNK-like factor isoform X2 [Cottoperca gobio]
MPKKRRRKMSDKEQETVVPAAPRHTEPTRSEASDESDGFTVQGDEEGRGGETPAADMNTTTLTDATSPAEDKKSKHGGQQTRLRTACPYGKDCYRKNPVHFQECSHPGDTDYEDEEEEEEEDEEEEEKPECPYGTDCYRKNPLHRREYKHTKKAVRTTRTVPKKADDEGDEGDEYDDSFINDDSEDAGDDSDYEPPVSEDSGKEDIAELQKEAKTFVKRRK